MKHILFLLLLLVGCDKEFVEPPLTANERFYCEIDGKIFRPRNKGSIYDKLTDPVLYTDYNFYKPNKSISIYAFNKIQDYGSVIIHLDFKKTGLKAFKLNIKENSSFASLNAGQIPSLQKDDDYSANYGFVDIIKLDTLQRQISGTFDFDMKSDVDSTKKIIKIRNGIFNNLKY